MCTKSTVCPCDNSMVNMRLHVCKVDRLTEYHPNNLNFDWTFSERMHIYRECGLSFTYIEITAGTSLWVSLHMDM